MADYMTVGELARMAGVTVRTVQYYDQQGLLNPSAKGPQGQRLYTSEDVQGLYRILTLKYLGLSLSDIRALQQPVDAEGLKNLINTSIEEIEGEFLQLFQRMNNLRALERKASDEVSWRDLAAVIEDGQDSGSFAWNLICVHDDQEAVDEAAQNGAEHWHSLIDQTIELMRADVDPKSPEAQALARKFLMAQNDGMPAEQQFVMIQSSMPSTHRTGGFGKMVGQVFDYLREAAKGLEGVCHE